MRCKACDNEMNVTTAETWNPATDSVILHHGHLEDVCSSCRTKAVIAETLSEHQLEGYWSDRNWYALGGNDDLTLTRIGAHL